MRINKFIALASGMSRRSADRAVEAGRVYIHGVPARTGQEVHAVDVVTLDGVPLTAPTTSQTVMLHKPIGYVVSRNGQGSKTVYDLLPPTLQHLKPIGRLDRDSSGLLLLTNDGQLAQTLTHPSYQKTKVYDVTLDRPLSDGAHQHLAAGVPLADGPSHLQVHATATPRSYRVAMQEGRNRQIRRTFTALGYKVTALHRLQFGPYTLGSLPPAHWQAVHLTG